MIPGILLYWFHFSHNKKRISLNTDQDSIAGYFLTLLHENCFDNSFIDSMHASLILYAEHEFNASTFTTRVISGTGSDIFSSISGSIGALRGPKHGGANEVAYEIIKRYQNPTDAEADILKNLKIKQYIGFGHPVYTSSDPTIIKDIAKKLSIKLKNESMFAIVELLAVERKEKCFNLIVQRRWFSPNGYTNKLFTPIFRCNKNIWLDCTPN